MSLSVKIPAPRALRIALALLLGIGAIANRAPGQSGGHPIEFSDPAQPLATPGVSALGEKPVANPAIDGIYHPSPVSFGRNLPNSLRPLPPMRGQVVFSKNQTGSAKNRALMSPEETMQEYIQRDILKLPQYSQEASSLDSPLPWERSSAQRQRTNYFNWSYSYNSGSDFDANRWGKSADAFGGYDPFGSFNRRGLAQDSSAGGNWSTERSGLPNDLGMQDSAGRFGASDPKREDQRLEAIRNTLSYHPPAASAVPGNGSSSAGYYNPQSYYGFAGSRSTQPAAGNAAQHLQAPGVPLPPAAPTAESSSLTPAPYAPPPKPTPAFFSPAQRRF